MAWNAETMLQLLSPNKSPMGALIAAESPTEAMAPTTIRTKVARDGSIRRSRP